MFTIEGSTRSIRGTTAALVALVATLAGGCAGQADSRTSEGEETVGQEVPRVPLAATAEDELPPAITGEGGDLHGMDLYYLPRDSATRGYLAVPEGEGPFPAVILIHEWNGLVERVRQMADDFAAEGYVALAADLYSGRTGSNREENRALTREVSGDMATVVANLDAAATWLREQPYVTGKIASIGWCFGGGIALSYALGGEEHEGTAIFYGRLVDDPEQLQAIDHEVYGTFAEMDGGIPPEQVESFVAALRSVGVDNDVHIYDEVNHGFWLRVDGDPDTRGSPALDAWQRLKSYLGRALARE